MRHSFILVIFLISLCFTAFSQKKLSCPFLHSLFGGINLNGDVETLHNALLQNHDVMEITPENDSVLSSIEIDPKLSSIYYGTILSTERKELAGLANGIRLFQFYGFTAVGNDTTNFIETSIGVFYEQGGHGKLNLVNIMSKYQNRLKKECRLKMKSPRGEVRNAETGELIEKNWIETKNLPPDRKLTLKMATYPKENLESLEIQYTFRKEIE